MRETECPHRTKTSTIPALRDKKHNSKMGPGPEKKKKHRFMENYSEWPINVRKEKSKLTVVREMQV